MCVSTAGYPDNLIISNVRERRTLAGREQQVACQPVLVSLCIWLSCVFLPVLDVNLIVLPASQLARMASQRDKRIDVNFVKGSTLLIHLLLILSSSSHTIQLKLHTSLGVCEMENKSALLLISLAKEYQQEEALSWASTERLSLLSLCSTKSMKYSNDTCGSIIWPYPSSSLYAIL